MWHASQSVCGVTATVYSISLVGANEIECSQFKSFFQDRKLMQQFMIFALDDKVIDQQIHNQYFISYFIL